MARRSFGQIRQLPSGRHQARYVDPEGRTKLTKSGNPSPVLHTAPWTFDAPIDAEAWLVAERRLISSGQWSPPADRQRAALEAERSRADRTFERYAWAWLEGHHHLRPTTRDSYAGAIRNHLAPAFGDTPIDQITATDVRAWFASYGDRTPTARSHAYQVLAAIMRQAVDDELIAKTPCRIKAGGKTRPAREPEVLTRAELFALADAMPEQHRALTLVCGLCGLRFGEAVALRRRDVDLDGRTLTVVRTASRGGGTKTVGPPKTDAGKRKVAMPGSVVDALRQHLAGQPVAGRDALVFPGRDGGLLAPTSLYGRAETPEKAAYGFYKAREAIGRPNLHWHDLRRTAATLGAQAGATVRENQHRLGHATADMALYYQHATAERDRAIADALDGPDGGGVSPLRRDGS